MVAQVFLQLSAYLCLVTQPPSSLGQSQISLLKNQDLRAFRNKINPDR